MGFKCFLYKILEMEVVFISKDVLEFTSQNFFLSKRPPADCQRAEYLNVENDSWENKDD
ncbi:hypothetical protein OKN5_29660 [Bacillus altitudinis]